MTDHFAMSAQGQTLAIILFIWSLFWKGLALWRAAKQDQKFWFVALLIINTVGILEIFYLFKFARKKMTWSELQSYFSNENLNVDKIKAKFRTKNRS